MVLLRLHLSGIGLGSRGHKASAGVHPHAHSHKSGHGSVSVGTCRFHASGQRALYIAFPYGGIPQHGSLIAQINEFFGFLVIGDAGDAYRLDLHAAVQVPVIIQHMGHILSQLPAF